jgi:hypothetical protein
LQKANVAHTNVISAVLFFEKCELDVETIRKLVSERFTIFERFRSIPIEENGKHYWKVTVSGVDS